GTAATATRPRPGILDEARAAVLGFEQGADAVLQVEQVGLHGLGSAGHEFTMAVCGGNSAGRRRARPVMAASISFPASRPAAYTAALHPASTRPTMSLRIQFSRHGGPEVLEAVQAPTPAPGPGQVRVRNHAIGLNFIDTYVRSGLYPPPTLPSGLGTEGAGVIEALGSQVSGWAIGDRVAYATGPLGAYAEQHLLPVANLVRLP